MFKRQLLVRAHTFTKNKAFNLLQVQFMTIQLIIKAISVTPSISTSNVFVYNLYIEANNEQIGLVMQ